MYFVLVLVFMKLPECFLPTLVPPTRIKLWLTSSGIGMTTASDMSIVFFPITNFTTRLFPSILFSTGSVPSTSKTTPTTIKTGAITKVNIICLVFIFKVLTKFRFSDLTPSHARLELASILLIRLVQQIYENITENGNAEFHL